MMRRLLLLVLLLPLHAAGPSGAASTDASAWWDESWHFRLPLTLRPEGDDPMTGRPVLLTGAQDPLVLVPMDLTAALRRASDGSASGWPFDAAGQPLSWTFLHESVRVVETGRALPARFLLFPLKAGAAQDASFDPRSHAAGTLLVLLPGVFDAPRSLDLYFDISENGPKAPATLSPTESARLDAFAGAGPGVSTMARVPPARAARIHALPAVPGEVTVRIERLPAGAAPELLSETRVAPPHALLALPTAASAYDVRVTASGPVLLLLEARGDTGAPTVLHASLDGSRAGRAFLVPPIEGATTLEVVGASARTSVTLEDAATGAALGSATVGRLASHAFPAPAGVARIDASAPVLVLSRPSTSGAVATLHQAAALEGGASGTILVGGRSDAHAATTGSPATVRAFPLARPQDVLSGRTGDPPREGWGSQAAPRTPPEAWAFSSDAPVSATLGRDGYAALQGVEGRAFRVPFATSREGARPALEGVLLAPFPGTTVDVRVQALNGTTLAAGATTLSTPGALATLPGGEPLLRDDAILSVDASLPVFVSAYRPDAGGVTPLPTLPAVVSTQEGTLSFFGPLLAWSEPVKESLARPGERARLGLELANRGRSPGGAPLVEDVALSLQPVEDSRCAASWDASLASATLAAMPSPGARTVDVFVQVPATAKAGECVELALRAGSSLDPRHAPEARLVVRARSGFQPELRVLTAEGPSASHRVSLDPGAPATVLMRLRNLGAETGRANVLVSDGPGYKARLLRDEDGKPLDGAVEVPGDAEKLLRLEVGAATGGEAPWDFFVQAIDVADPTSRDEAVVSVAPRTNLTLLATLEPARLAAPPGGAADATLRLRNLGQDVEVRARLATAAPDGWTVRFTPERLLLRAAGSEDASGEPLDAANVRLEVRPPADARVGDSRPLVVVVEPTLTPTASVHVPLSVLVANDYALDVEAPASLTLAPSSDARVHVGLSSRASAAFDVSLRAQALPRGWEAAIEGIPLRLAPGEEGGFTLHARALPAAPAGTGAIRIELLLEDGVSPPRVVPVEISAATTEGAELRVRDAPTALRLAPHERGRVLLRLDNEGNAPWTGALDLRLEGGLAGNLTADEGPLAASGARLVEVVLTAPPTRFGRATADVLDMETGATLATIEVVEARRDVAIVEAALGRTPEGVPVLDLLLENRGEVPTGLLNVSLRSGDALLGSVTLPALAPGNRTRHAFLAAGLQGALHVGVGGEDGAPDATPEDNQATATLREAPSDAVPAGRLDALREVPAPSLFLALAAAALLAARWRRRAP